MGRISLVALSFVSLGGCGYATAMKSGTELQPHDASTSSVTALVEGSEQRPFHPACSIVWGDGLYREVVVDAGPVKLQVACSRVHGVFGEQLEQMGRAGIAFHAHAGQRYRVVVSEDFGFSHVAVLAAGDGAPVIQRSLLGSGSAAHAAANATLISRNGSGVIPCRFARPWTERKVSAIRRPADSFVNEPYSHQIVAECSTYAYVTGDVKERYEAAIDFVPKSGHLYTVHMDEQNRDFLFVTDVSSDVRTIAHVRAIQTH